MKTLKLGHASILVILGILVAIFFSPFFTYIKYTLSAIIIYYGVVASLFSVIEHKKDFYKHYEFFWGIIEIVIGLVIIFAIQEKEIIYVMWGSWSIANELTEIKELINRVKERLPVILTTIESIVNIILSILLIIHREDHEALIHVYLLIVELIFSGLLEYADHIIIHVRENKKKKIEEIKESTQE